VAKPQNRFFNWAANAAGSVAGLALRARGVPPPPTATTDPEKSLILAAAWAIFGAQKYPSIAMISVAKQAQCSEAALLKHYPNKEALLAAALEAYSPRSALANAFSQASGTSGEELVRNAFYLLHEAASQHALFFRLALLEREFGQGEAINALGLALAGDAAAFFSRLKATSDLRPVPDLVLGRAIAAMLIGYIASEQVVPGGARMALRMLAPRAWLDGTVDLLLHGILEG
jgi:AcrR family transcriptional regulator